MSKGGLHVVGMQPCHYAGYPIETHKPGCLRYQTADKQPSNYKKAGFPKEPGLSTENPQIFKPSNFQILKSSNLQITKFSNPLIFKFSNFQITQSLPHPHIILRIEIGQLMIRIDLDFSDGAC